MEREGRKGHTEAGLLSTVRVRSGRTGRQPFCQPAPCSVTHSTPRYRKGVPRPPRLGMVVGSAQQRAGLLEDAQCLPRSWGEGGPAHSLFPVLRVWGSARLLGSFWGSECSLPWAPGI